MEEILHHLGWLKHVETNFFISRQEKLVQDFFHPLLQEWISPSFPMDPTAFDQKKTPNPQRP